MQTLTQAEARKLLNAHGIKAYLPRNRQVKHYGPFNIWRVDHEFRVAKTDSDFINGVNQR